MTLRVLLASAVILLSSAPMEIADSGVNTLGTCGSRCSGRCCGARGHRQGSPWPRSSLLSPASTIIVILFAPLLAMRLFVLRRPREHAVTAGWLAGCLLQARFVVVAAVAGQSRLVGGGGPPPAGTTGWGNSLTFYPHDVVLRASRLALVVAA